MSLLWDARHKWAKKLSIRKTIYNWKDLYQGLKNVNSVDPDNMSHNEPPNWCLRITWSIERAKEFATLEWPLIYGQSQVHLGGSVGCAVRLKTRRSRVQPPPRSATFFRGDWSWNIFYGHSLPSADSRRAVVSFWRKNVHNTVNRLED